MTTTMTENDRLRLEDIDRRLTAVQREIRSRLEKLPRHVRRSIDRQRQSLGMVPLWGETLEPRRKLR
jgi:type VI protein secretion system component VasF